MDIDGNNRKSLMHSHADGEVWGLAIIPESDIFITCGDDNRIYEFSISQKRCIRQGKIFTSEMNDGQAYDQGKKPRSTASTMSKYPA